MDLNREVAAPQVCTTNLLLSNKVMAGVKPGKSPCLLHLRCHKSFTEARSHYHIWKWESMRA